MATAPAEQPSTDVPKDEDSNKKEQGDTKLIRPVQPSDMPRVRQLHAICLPIEFTEPYFDMIQCPRMLTLVSVIKRASTATRVDNSDDNHELSSSSNELVIGFITGFCKNNRFFVLPLTTGYIYNLGVDPEYRRSGLGATLVRIFISFLYTKVPMYVVVPRDNSYGYEYLQEPRGNDPWIRYLEYYSPLEFFGRSLVAATRRVESFIEAVQSPVTSDASPNVSTSSSTSAFSSSPQGRLKEVWLHVLETNEPALQLYRRMNFVIKGKLDKFYNFNGADHNAYALCLYMEHKDDVTNKNDTSSSRRFLSERLKSYLSSQPLSEAFFGKNLASPQENPVDNKRKWTLVAVFGSGAIIASGLSVILYACS